MNRPFSLQSGAGCQKNFTPCEGEEVFFLDIPFYRTRPLPDFPGCESGSIAPECGLRAISAVPACDQDRSICQQCRCREQTKSLLSVRHGPELSRPRVEHFDGFLGATRDKNGAIGERDCRELKTRRTHRSRSLEAPRGRVEGRKTVESVRSVVPPMMRTVPSLSTAPACLRRVVRRLPVEVNWPVPGS